MEIGTHNSMTYLPLKKWYMYVYNFVAKCQSKTIEEQYEKYGIRAFDLRISFDNKGIPEFRHGLVRYKGSVEKVLKYLNSKGDTKVRIVYEDPADKGILKDTNTELFKRACLLYILKYKKIKFYAGFRKSDRLQIINFKYKPSLVEKVASVQTSTKLDDLWPWLYAKRHNKEPLSDSDKDKDIVALDFIEIK